jgi:hypothetical protein
MPALKDCADQEFHFQYPELKLRAIENFLITVPIILIPEAEEYE